MRLLTLVRQRREDWLDVLSFLLLAGGGGLLGWGLRLAWEGGWAALVARRGWLTLWSLVLLALCVAIALLLWTRLRDADLDE